jgi:phage anti-repressor protein
MNLQILVSKKGTKVLKATNLYVALELPTQHYERDVKKWLTNIYEFSDGIRRPERMADYAPCTKPKDAIIKDYYLSIELAKLITLSSNSKVKLKYAKQLFSLEDKHGERGVITKEQAVSIIELTKAMGLMSCQEASEEQHRRLFEEQHADQSEDWWKHRIELLGYSVEQLKDRLREQGKDVRGKSLRQLLLELDQYEVIRGGIIDLFMALGKTERYARTMGDLSKRIAKELAIDIHDDRVNGSLFAPTMNMQVIQEVKNLDKGTVLGVW